MEKVIIILNIPQECGEPTVDIISLSTGNIIEHVPFGDYYVKSEIIKYKIPRGKKIIIPRSIVSEIDYSTKVGTTINTNFQNGNTLEILTLKAEKDPTVENGWKLEEEHTQYSVHEESKFIEKDEFYLKYGISVYKRLNSRMEDIVKEIFKDKYEIINLYKY